MIYQSCITFIFISLIEHVYSFTVRTINDAAESIRISDPSEAVSCKTKAMGKISILMKMLIELFFVSVLRNFLQCYGYFAFINAYLISIWLTKNQIVLNNLEARFMTKKNIWLPRTTLIEVLWNTTLRQYWFIHVTLLYNT